VQAGEGAEVDNQLTSNATGRADVAGKDGRQDPLTPDDYCEP
jgi:hypothetical protein